MIHLARNVCDGCAVWCHFDRDNIGDPCARVPYEDKADHYEDGYTSNPAEATCVPCLVRTEAYGAMCRDRHEFLAYEHASRQYNAMRRIGDDGR